MSENLDLGILSDLYGKDLAGWQITPLYYLELRHGLMGTFPAVTSKDRKMVFVTDKPLLQKVWDQLDPREAKVSQFLAVVNPTLRKAFNLQNDMQKSKTTPVTILLEEDLSALCTIEGSFNWAPGLVTFDNGPFNSPVI